MFDINEINKVIQDEEVVAKYNEYLQLAKTKPERITQLNKLHGWVMNIAMGESGGFSLKQLVIGVIEAAIYTYSHTLQEHIDKANEAMSEKFNNLSPETQELIINNNKKLEKFAPITPTPIIESEGLSIESQFKLASFVSAVDSMSIEQAKELLKDCFKQSLIKDKMYQKLLKKEWGIK